LTGARAGEAAVTKWAVALRLLEENVATSTALPYLAIDFDNHYYEQDDCYTRYIEPEFRDRAIHPVTIEGGVRPWMLGDQVVSWYAANAADSIAPPGALEKLFAGGATQEWSEDSLISAWDYPEMINRAARLPMLDRQGIEAAVLIPTAGLGIEWEFRKQVPALCANLRAFNRWVEDEWGYGGDGRSFGVPMLTLLDLDWAIAELERTAALGSRLAFLMTGPVADRSPADPVFDPFWARAQEIGVRPIFHIGASGFADHYASHWSEDPNRGVIYFSALQNYLALGERPVGDTMAALLLHNLFGRFPDLEVISLENGSSWAAPMMRGVDKAAHVVGQGPWLGGKLTEAPSETFKRHVYIAPYFEDDILGLVDLIGADHVLFGSDWPHPEGVAEPLDFMKYVVGLSDDDLRKVMRDNGARLLGLDKKAAIG
jgi:predicted TIM-barrel fold metal-dependent hydrolase